ncbi:MFS transporter [Priestia megaterium]
MHYVFVFVVFGIGAILFVKKFLPETKGLTLEELEQRFRSYDNEDADVMNDNKII